MPGCTWQFPTVGQCWTNVDHDSPDAGIVLPLLSFAEPEKAIGSPTDHVSDDEGAAMVTVGGVPTVTVVVAIDELVAARHLEPNREGPGVVNVLLAVGVVASVKFPLPRSHAYVRFVPVDPSRRS